MFVAWDKFSTLGMHQIGQNKYTFFQTTFKLWHVRSLQ